MSAAATGWSSRLGHVSRAVAPSLLFYGADKEAFEAIAPVLSKLSRSEQRLEAILCAKDAELVRWLEQRFPDLRSLMAPVDMARPTTKFFKRLRIRVVVLLEEEAFPSQHFEKAVGDRSVLLAVISGRGRARLQPREKHAGLVPALLLAVDREMAKSEENDGRVTLVTSASGQFDDGAAAAALDHLLPLAGRNVKWNNRRDRPLRRSFARWLHRGLGKPGFAARCRRFVERYDNLDQLRRELGDPETILCLGNGPSSEDPKLADITYDAMFRVNHSWMDRPVLTDADVVFTGGGSTMKAIETPIFGLQDQIGEMLLLATKGAGILRRRLRYFSMKRMGGHLHDFDWGQHRPTNGAAMIALAVALEPKCIVIAGVDLFRHPDGSYPGDSKTPNAYTPSHSADKELAFMFHHLDQFEGNCVFIGEILAREWQHHRAQRQDRLDKAG